MLVPRLEILFARLILVLARSRHEVAPTRAEHVGDRLVVVLAQGIGYGVVGRLRSREVSLLGGLGRGAARLGHRRGLGCLRFGAQRKASGRDQGEQQM